MKKKKIIISILVISFIVALLSFIIYSNDRIHFKLSYEYINYYEYNNGKTIEVSIPKDNRIKYVDEEEVLDFFDNGTGILYFGYNTCPWCRNMIPVLIDSVLENDYETIYYADIHDLDISSISDKLFTKLADYLSTNEEGEKGLSVPDVYFVKDGVIVGRHLGTVDSYVNPFEEMTKNQKQELKDIFNKYIKELK